MNLMTNPQKMVIFGVLNLSATNRRLLGTIFFARVRPLAPQRPCGQLLK